MGPIFYRFCYWVGKKLMSNGIFAFAKYVNSRYAHYHFLHVRYVFHGLGNLWPFVIYEPPYASPPKNESFNISTTDPHSSCDKKMPLKMQIDLKLFAAIFQQYFSFSLLNLTSCKK